MSNISNSIELYCRSQEDCNIIKILTNPTDHLKLLGQKREPMKMENDPFYNIMGLMDNIPIDFEETKKFISTKEEFETFLQHIQNMLIKGYQNYVDDSVKMPNKLYRAVCQNEIDFLASNKKIETFYSTDSNMDDLLGFIIEKQEHDWNPKQRFILEIPIYEKIPFIDVDNDSKTIFEPNEIILLPSFNVSKLRLKNKGKSNLFGMYDEKYMTRYTCKISPQMVTPSSNISEINKLHESLMINLTKYESHIQGYINHEIGDNIFKDNDFKNWIISLKRYIYLQRQYVYDCVLHDKLPEEIKKGK